MENPKNGFLAVGARAIRKSADDGRERVQATGEGSRTPSAGVSLAAGELSRGAAEGESRDEGDGGPQGGQEPDGG